MKKETKSIKEITEDYLLKRPLLIEYLKQGLVNISALARKIKQEEKITKSQEAIMMALFRIEKTRTEKNKKVEEILNKTEIAFRTGYAVIVSKKELKIEAEATLNFGKKYIYIVQQNKIKKIDAISIKKDLFLIEFIHPLEVEDIPGVVFHILAIFYEMNISIVEMLSSWDRTYILIEEKDAEKIIAKLLKKRKK